MFFHSDLKGAGLRPKELCLTFDDGPGETPGWGAGPRTSQLGRYLYDQAIQAAFFMIGRHAEQHLRTLRRLADWGHTLGNHTYSHPGLVSLVQAGGSAIDEIARTDAFLRPLVTTETIFFRAPYGNWREKETNSEQDCRESIVAHQLNRCDVLHHYVGPVNWDISAEDFMFWRRGAAAEEAANAYLEAIENAGRGIILLHDSSEEPAMRQGNRTFELTQQLVHELRRRGYRFVTLSEAVNASMANTS